MLLFSTETSSEDSMDYPDPASGDTTTSPELKVKRVLRSDEKQKWQPPKV